MRDCGGDAPPFGSLPKGHGSEETAEVPTLKKRTSRSRGDGIHEAGKSKTLPCPFCLLNQQEKDVNHNA